MTDPALINAAQAGDRQAFARLVETEYDFIYRLAYRWCGNVPDAEDVAQQACIKLAQCIGQYRFDAAFRTWLYRLVINCAKDWQRSQTRHQTEALPDDYAAASHMSAETGLFLAAVLNWIASLGEGFKEAVLLVLGEGMTHAEAAHILEIKESTVSWRIHEVRKRLQQWRGDEP
ncbi:RNA polymerase sigma factor [Simiduia agarivorans]|uniref:Sigma-24 FecI-like protein n=1 Tax=Simiduia agarivorans (strain DSM 21679 / JCM 13881 / BCRC 17597 / SA1) TaxID=1117647 RepID=K4KM28_SIMAS|nr:RNA polymerase sigma factor [Simiduia agarivorans]AFU99275.1 sigma-24 FecI-like protein [Simiduia agarivorans SA1 = DSM 21679]